MACFALAIVAKENWLNASVLYVYAISIWSEKKGNERRVSKSFFSLCVELSRQQQTAGKTLANNYEAVESLG